MFVRVVEEVGVGGEDVVAGKGLPREGGGSVVGDC